MKYRSHSRERESRINENPKKWSSYINENNEFASNNIIHIELSQPVSVKRDRMQLSTYHPHVPECAILYGASRIEASMRACASLADVAVVVEEQLTHERQLAALDTYLYPAPQAECPPRMWDPMYGHDLRWQKAPSRRVGSRRNLKLGWWERLQHVIQEKCYHQSIVKRKRQRLEDLVWSDVLLCGTRQIWIEPNMFPYHCPKGVEHWILWSSNKLQHKEISKAVEGFITSIFKDCVSWNYDGNGDQYTIDLFHVHIYLCFLDKADIENLWNDLSVGNYSLRSSDIIPDSDAFEDKSRSPRRLNITNET